MRYNTTTTINDHKIDLLKNLNRTLHLWIRDILYNNLYPTKQRIEKTSADNEEKANSKGNMPVVCREQPAKMKER